MRISIFSIIILFFTGNIFSQELALLQYGGGGDWYANPTSLHKLAKLCNQNINTSIKQKSATVSRGNVDIFDYPFVRMTGHGHVFFSAEEPQNLQDYLMSGGLLHIYDNYGIG